MFNINYFFEIIIWNGFYLKVEIGEVIGIGDKWKEKVERFLKCRIYDWFIFLKILNEIEKKCIISKFLWGYFLLKNLLGIIVSYIFLKRVVGLVIENWS